MAYRNHRSLKAAFISGFAEPGFVRRTELCGFFGIFRGNVSFLGWVGGKLIEFLAVDQIEFLRTNRARIHSTFIALATPGEKHPFVRPLDCLPIEEWLETAPIQWRAGGTF